MDQPRDGTVTSFVARDTPRREAVRTLGAAGTALLGLLGLSTAVEAKGHGQAKRNRKAKAKDDAHAE